MLNTKKQFLNLILVFIFTFFLVGCKFTFKKNTIVPISKNTNRNAIKVTGNLKVNYMNLGTLIQQNGHNMFITMANNTNSDIIINYLKKQKVKKLDYIIIPYLHRDNMYVLNAIENTFDIDTIFILDCMNTFKDVVTITENKHKKMSIPKIGDTFKLGNAIYTVLSSNEAKDKNLNMYSLLIKLKFGSNSFMFVINTENVLEDKILKNQLTYSADVLKIESNTKLNTETLLNKVNPKYAIVSFDKNNKYDPPTYDMMHKLSEKDITIFRTDEQGTIQAISNGKNITWNVKPWENKTLNGFCSRVLKNDNYYVGYWKDNFFNGNGILKYKNGHEYEGDFVKGKKQGFGTYTFENGDEYEGEWLNDKINGFGICTFENGDKYEGDWSNGKMNGFGTYIFENGDKYEGDWSNGKMNGLGTYTFESGDKYEGEWSNNQLIISK